MPSSDGLDATHRRIRPIVLARDGYRCMCPGCGKCEGWCQRRATTTDHIRARVEGGANTLANYRAMCGPCNSSLGATLGNRRRATHPFFLKPPP